MFEKAFVNKISHKLLMKHKNQLTTNSAVSIGSRSKKQTFVKSASSTGFGGSPKDMATCFDIIAVRFNKLNRN